jgi:hypothetical protein
MLIGREHPAENGRSSWDLQFRIAKAPSGVDRGAVTWRYVTVA